MDKFALACAAVFASVLAHSALCADVGSERANLWGAAKMPANEARAQAALDNQIGREIRGEQKSEPGKVRIRSVKEPYYRLFNPAGGGRRGLVIVAPGGGYYLLAADHEGEAICRRLNESGIAAMLLIYRVPDNPQGALQDIQRAVRLARANAEKWNVDPGKIAVMGFSAGANLCARASANSGAQSYSPTDEIDSQSARPDNTLLIYPAYCDARGYNSRWRKPQSGGDSYSDKYALAVDLKIDKNTPPAFIVQSQNDSGCINSSFAYYLALKDAGVPACLHIFDKGGHGYGLGRKGMLASAWGDLAVDWLKRYGYCAEK